MNKELRDKLLKDFLDLFPKENPLFRKGSGIPFFIDCEDGWYKILYSLCTDLRELLKENPIDQFIVLQVKEKFGGLRFYIGAGSEKIFARIVQAEVDSVHTCEYCGQPGKIRWKLPWIRTLCDKHYKEKLKEYKELEVDIK